MGGAHQRPTVAQIGAKEGASGIGQAPHGITGSVIRHAALPCIGCRGLADAAAAA
jgi:hypothetical protein